MPIETRTEDHVAFSIKNELPPDNPPALCTSKPWSNGQGINESGRRVGWLNKRGKCKTVGQGPKMRKFSEEDGMLMVLVRNR
jgi:hypothetical protein